VPELVAQGVRLTMIGRRDRLPRGVLEAVERAEAATRHGRRLALRLAIDYSARYAIVAAARHAAAAPRLNGEPRLDRDAFARFIGQAVHAGEPARDLDLLIRTGGEQRLSDFLLW